MNPIEINEPVSVVMTFNARTQKSSPYKIKWKNNTYKVDEVASHLPEVIKGIDHHNYICLCGETLMELTLNTKTLQWILLKITPQS